MSTIQSKLMVLFAAAYACNPIFSYAIERNKVLNSIVETADSQTIANKDVLTAATGKTPTHCSIGATGAIGPTGATVAPGHTGPTGPTGFPGPKDHRSGISLVLAKSNGAPTHLDDNAGIEFNAVLNPPYGDLLVTQFSPSVIELNAIGIFHVSFGYSINNFESVPCAHFALAISQHPTGPFTTPYNYYAVLGSPPINNATSSYMVSMTLTVTTTAAPTYLQITNISKGPVKLGFHLESDLDLTNVPQAYLNIWQIN